MIMSTTPFHPAHLDALKAAVRARRLIVVAGAGVSRGAGIPLWHELLSECMPEVLRQRGEEGREIAAQMVSVAQRLPLQAADIWWAWLEEQEGLEPIRGFLGQTFLRGSGPALAHEQILALGRLAGPGIVTTNFDDLFERCGPELEIRTHSDRALGTLLAPQAGKFLLHLHGSARNVETIVLTSTQYGQLSVQRAYEMLLGAAQLSWTLLFVGYGGYDPALQQLREKLVRRFDGDVPNLYMLLDRPTPAQCDALRRQRVVVADFDGPRDGYGVVNDLLGVLLDAACSLPSVAPPSERPALAEGDQQVRSLIEAMGYRIAAEHQMSGGGWVCLGHGKFGPEIRQDLIWFVPGDVDAMAVEQAQQSIATYGQNRAVILTAAPVRDAVRAAASATGRVDVVTLVEYEARLADFAHYAETLKHAYEESEIPRYYVDLRCRSGKSSPADVSVLSLDAFAADWLAAPERNHVSLLGDFGMGKTWFSRRLAYRQACRYLAAPERERVPILIFLRDYARAYDVEQAITHALVNQLGVTLSGGYKTFRYLNEHGKLLLIFDGFDEMQRQVSDYRTVKVNFEELARVVAPASKIVLTCRTAYFRHREEEHEVLQRRARGRVIDRDRIIELEGREGFEVAHLQLFDDQQLRAALEKRLPDRWQGALDKIKRIHDLPNLAQRPVLLDMITRTLDRLGGEERINHATLYEGYTSELMRRRIGDDDFSPEQRRYFVEELAWDMNRREGRPLRFDEFPVRVKEHFHLENDPEAALFLERDIRTQTYVRDDAGNYSFGHPSFMEFFVARRLYDLLKKGEGDSCPVNEAIRSFVAAFAEREPFVSERRPTPDGMIYIPPGPFFLGEVAEIRVACLTHGVFIDERPVTVAEYLEFVTWVERGGRRAHANCHPDEPKRKDHRPAMPAGNIPMDYFTAERYRRFPVVLVDWFDAHAFAAWKKKRLPADEEWEKAARGPFGRIYPWGDDFDRTMANSAEHWAERELSDLAQWDQWWKSAAARRAMPTEPGAFPGRSPYRCVDLAGNVWEWTKSPNSRGNEWRTVCGGSFDFPPRSLRASWRRDDPPVSRYGNVGFRCARDV